MSVDKGSSGKVAAVLALAAVVIAAVVASVVLRDNDNDSEKESCLVRYAQNGAAWMRESNDESVCRLREYLFERGVWPPSKAKVPSPELQFGRNNTLEGAHSTQTEIQRSCDVDEVIVVPAGSSVWEQVYASLAACRITHLTPQAVNDLGTKQSDIGTVQANFRAILKSDGSSAQMWPMDPDYYIGYVKQLTANAPYGEEQDAFWDGVCYAADAIMDAPTIDRASGERLDLLARVGVGLAEHYQLSTILDDLGRVSQHLMAHKGMCDK